MKIGFESTDFLKTVTAYPDTYTIVSGSRVLFYNINKEQLGRAYTTAENLEKIYGKPNLFFNGEPTALVYSNMAA